MKNSSCKYGKSMPICENCLKQLEKIEYLMKTLAKFTMVRSNLDAVLGSHRSVLNRERIGYSGKINLLESKSFLNMRKRSFVICFYYCEIGNASSSCYFKNFGVPKGKYK